MSRLPERPRIPEPLCTGLDAMVHSLIGRYRRRGNLVKTLLADAQRTQDLRQKFKELSKSNLTHELREARATLRRNPSETGEPLLSALAAVFEAASRTLGLDPFMVQSMGALALARGYLAEMATGEGKTLTAGLAATLIAWRGRPCHIVTVNDYLVERDAGLLLPLFEICGVSAGHVVAEMNPGQRRAAYQKDITYATSKELAADFLRDQLQLGAMRDPDRRLLHSLLKPTGQPLVMRGLHAAIVDEADSLLIDEAVTPLIISTKCENESLRAAVETARMLSDAFEPGLHYHPEARFRGIEFTRVGEEMITKAMESHTGIWKMRDRGSELLRQALVAREFYKEGQQFIIREGKIVIVDEFTGRPMADRTWRMGLHQAVEARQGLAITDPTETVARISFQKFFRLYRQLSGMTGTAREAAAEFWRVYELPVLQIPSNRPCIRRESPFQSFPSAGLKLEAIVQRVMELHATGRPVLVGTRTVRASEQLAERLLNAGVDSQVLNASRIREEALIVSRAGQPGNVTIATNMAGRGTDIRLGPGVAEAGGLCVVATERHESGRVDRQLIGRCARQGDPGSSESFGSAEDEMLTKFSPRLLRKSALRFPFLAPAVFALAQRNAQRQAFQQRKRVLESDNWLEQSLSFAEK